MDWRFNTIWFEQLGAGKLFKKDFKDNVFGDQSHSFESSEYAILWHLKEKENSFDNLPPSNKLLYLDLHWANIKNLVGIKKIENLKRLQLHYCIKLETDEGLGRLNNTLEFLHIDQSKKFKFSDDLLKLKKLRVLRLNDCGPLDNLDFLSNFPHLIDFRFVNTNILDGNLRPILEHPTIRTVGFLNKKHYNYKEDKLKSELKNKFSDEYKTKVYKGEFETFRYDYE
jgi:hypothetical protein